MAKRHKLEASAIAGLVAAQRAIMREDQARIVAEARAREQRLAADTQAKNMMLDHIVAYATQLRDLGMPMKADAEEFPEFLGVVSELSDNIKTISGLFFPQDTMDAALEVSPEIAANLEQTQFLPDERIEVEAEQAMVAAKVEEPGLIPQDPAQPPVRRRVKELTAPEITKAAKPPLETPKVLTPEDILRPGYVIQSKISGREVHITKEFVASVNGNSPKIVVEKLQSLANNTNVNDFKKFKDLGEDVYQIDLGLHHRIMIFRDRNRYVVTHIVHKNSSDSVRDWTANAKEAERIGKRWRSFRAVHDALKNLRKMHGLG